MTARASVVFLLDVDNTLLDNDRVIADLQRHLAQAFGTDDKPPGAERADRHWAIFEARRAAAGLRPDVFSVASIFVSRWDVAVMGKVPEALPARAPRTRRPLRSRSTPWPRPR